MRLQKYLAAAGIASRRKCEEYILRGLIKVNGRVVAALGTKIDTKKDKVEFRNKPVSVGKKYIYIVLNKPTDIVTTCRQRGEIPVTALVTGIKERLFPVGRLDKDSTGLVILTNDGDFAYRMTHPKFEHEKEYAVKTVEPVSKHKLENIQNSLKAGNKIIALSSRKFRIILIEGQNRQIRKMFGSIGVEVDELHRIRIGNIKLGNLDAGKWKEIEINVETNSA